MTLETQVSEISEALEAKRQILYARLRGAGRLMIAYSGGTDSAYLAYAAHEVLGHALALQAEMHSGFAFAMVDTVAQFGHMTELYQPELVLTDFYAMVATVSGNFGDGVLQPIILS